MRPLRHPENYSSLVEYREHLVKLRASLAKKLTVGMRYGLCTNEIMEWLKYIWIMLFWVDKTLENVGVSESNPVTPEPETPPVVIEIGPFLLIDSTHFLLIDTSNKLKI